MSIKRPVVVQLDEYFGRDSGEVGGQIAEVIANAVLLLHVAATNPKDLLTASGLVENANDKLAESIPFGDHALLASAVADAVFAGLPSKARPLLAQLVQALADDTNVPDGGAAS